MAQNTNTESNAHVMGGSGYQNYNDDNVYASESQFAAGTEDTIDREPTGKAKRARRKKKKKQKIKQKQGFFSHWTILQVTLILFGILAAAGMCTIFYYMYESARMSTRPIPQSGLVTTDNDKSWMTRVVNQNAGLASDIEVTTSTVTGAPGVMVDSRATKSTVELLKAVQENVPDEVVGIKAGYTSVADYVKAFNEELARVMDEQDIPRSEAVPQVLTTMMQPGTDEHSTGLLINFSVNDSMAPDYLTGSQTVAWLRENAYKYGFIERYPQGQEETTLHGYDPSAYRYVGVENAKAMHEGGYPTLEAYNAAVKEAAAQAAAEQAAAEQAAAEAAAAEQAAQAAA